MEVEEEEKGEEGGNGTLRKMGEKEFLKQEAERSGTTLVDDRNGFNNLIRLEMLKTLRLITIGIRHNFYSTRQGCHQLQF